MTFSKVFEFLSEKVNFLSVRPCDLNENHHQIVDWSHFADFDEPFVSQQVDFVSLEIDLLLDFAGRIVWPDFVVLTPCRSINFVDSKRDENIIVSIFHASLHFKKSFLNLIVVSPLISQLNSSSEALIAGVIADHCNAEVLLDASGLTHSIPFYVLLLEMVVEALISL